jgi:hypothetical protein
MIAAKYKLIVITPVYEDVEASSRLFKELKAQFDKEIFLVGGAVRDLAMELEPKDYVLHF